MRTQPGPDRECRRESLLSETSFSWSPSARRARVKKVRYTAYRTVVFITPGVLQVLNPRVAEFYDRGAKYVVDGAAWLFTRSPSLPMNNAGAIRVGGIFREPTSAAGRAFLSTEVEWQ